MDDARFDEISRRIASRRTILGGLSAAVVGLAGSLPDFVAAKPKKKKKKKKKCASGAVRCGTACVNLKTDAQHCGACGNTCQNNETCRNGVCAASQCSANQIDCGGGRCIPDVAHACCNQGGCGGDSGANPLECRNDRCVCKTAGEGICNWDAQSGRGTCHTCCPGGDRECPGDQVCFNFTVTSGGIPVEVAGCDCPTSWQRCQFNHPAGTCVQYPNTTADKCGPNCEICSAHGEGSICSGGLCSRGCDPGNYCPQNTVCNPGCNPCGPGFICCNQGPDTPPSCIQDRDGGTCYRLFP